MQGLGRMKKYVIGIILCIYYLPLLLIACDYPEPQIPCEVQPSEQTGTYSMETAEVSGNCKPMGSLQVDIENGVVYIDRGVGCEVADSSWDAFQCAAKSKFACDDGWWIINLDWTSISDPADPDKLTGTLKAKIESFAGSWSCESEYTFEAARLTSNN